MAAGQPKPAFYVALAVVVFGLIAFAYYRSDIVAPKPRPAAGGGQGQPQAGKIEPKDLGLEQAAESADTASPTTVKEYKFKPAEKLPPVKGTAAYKPLQNNTVRFALNVWAGWAPIVLANNGFKAGKEWKTADGKPFKVELVLIDNPVEMRDAYAAGEVHIGWATLDMVPLFLESFVDAQGNPRDSRIMPRIYQQVDLSNGGDGIVVRENIKTVADLRGKKLVLAQNSPSHYFALNMLVAGGVQPSEVQDGLHRRRLPGGRRVQRPEGHRRLRLLGAGHLQPGQGQGQPPARDHAAGQPPDRRRLVRPRRLRPRPHGHHRGDHARHLRRDGAAQGRRPSGRRSRG